MSKEIITIEPTGGSQVGNNPQTRMLDLSTQVTKGTGIEERLVQCTGSLKVAHVSVPAVSKLAAEITCYIPNNIP